MRTRPIIALTASLALLGGGPVLAAAGDPGDRPVAGAATSSLTLLDVALGGTSLSVLELALRSDTLSGTPATSFVVTPLTVGSKAYGRQSLTSRSAALPAVDTTALAPAALSAVAAARSPLVDVSVDGGSSRAGTASLGSISVLGMPLTLDGRTSLSSTVDAGGATGGKTLTVTELALPSVADLVTALGLDLTAVPAGSLTDLLSGLDLTSTLLVEAQAKLDATLAQVRQQVAAAEAAVAGTTSAVDSATEQLAVATAALTPVTNTLNDATRAVSGITGGALRRGNLAGLDLPTAPVAAPTTTTISAPVTTATDPVTTVTAPVTAPAVDALPVPVAEPVTAPATSLVTDVVAPVVEDSAAAVDSTLGTVTDTVVQPVVAVLPALPTALPAPTLPVTLPVSLQPVADAYTAAKQAYDDARKAVADAELSLANARQLLTDAQAALDTLLAPYQEQVDALVAAAIDLLDATPLLSLDRLEVTTRSAVTSAAAGGQSAEILGGQVQGLRVLGTDVLDSALGASRLDVLDLAGPVKSKVDSAIRGLTGTLSSTLSQVPGLPALQVPAPTVDLLTRATATHVVDGFGVAGSALRAVSVTWPGLTIPAAAALPGAAGLPAVGGVPPLSALRRGSLLAAGNVLSQPLTLSLATLEDRARFRPAQLSLQPGTGAPGTGAPGTGAPTTGVPAGAPTTGAPTTGTPGTGTPGTDAPTTGTPGAGTPGTTVGAPRSTPPGLTQLPRTGASSAPSIVALLLLVMALGLHRRYRSA